MTTGRGLLTPTKISAWRECAHILTRKQREEVFGFGKGFGDQAMASPKGQQVFVERYFFSGGAGKGDGFLAIDLPEMDRHRCGEVFGPDIAGYSFCGEIADE